MRPKPFYFTDISHCALCNWCRCRLNFFLIGAVAQNNPYHRYYSSTSDKFLLAQLHIHNSWLTQCSKGHRANVAYAGQRRLTSAWWPLRTGNAVARIDQCSCTSELFQWCSCTFEVLLVHLCIIFVDIIDPRRNALHKSDYWQISKVAFFLVSCFPCWTKPYNCCSTKSRQTWYLSEK